MKEGPQPLLPPPPLPQKKRQKYKRKMRIKEQGSKKKSEMYFNLIGQNLSVHQNGIFFLRSVGHQVEKHLAERKKNVIEFLEEKQKKKKNKKKENIVEFPLKFIIRIPQYLCRRQ